MAKTASYYWPWPALAESWPTSWPARLGAELRAILDDLQWRALDVSNRRLAEEPDRLAAYLAQAELLSGEDLRSFPVLPPQGYPEYSGGGQ